MKLVVASEYSDPAFYQDICINRLVAMKELHPICLLLITKDIGRCENLLRACRALNVGVLTHITITGYGNTIFEPGVKPVDKVTRDTLSLMSSGFLNPHRTVLRVDPLIPLNVEPLTADYRKVLDLTLAEFSHIGVTRVRTSIIDYYQHVKKRFLSAGVSVPNGFHLPLDKRISEINSLAEIASRYSMTVEVCSEGISPKLLGDNVSIKGCADASDWPGVELDEMTNSQRILCTCNLAKEDLLKGLEKGCGHKCLYCYWRDGKHISTALPLT